MKMMRPPFRASKALFVALVYVPFLTSIVPPFWAAVPFIADRTVARKRQLPAANGEQWITYIRDHVVAVQINLGIACKVIGSLKNEIIRKPDGFVGFTESPFKVPYSTDVSRGY